MGNLLINCSLDGAAFRLRSLPGFVIFVSCAVNGNDGMLLRRITKIVATVFPSLVLFAIAGTPVLAQEIHSKHCLFGCPDGLFEQSDLILRENYLLSVNHRTKLADWVAFKARKSLIGEVRGINWKIDPALNEAGTLGPEDYIATVEKRQYEPVFLVPPEDFSDSQNWGELYYSSHAVPQRPALKVGAWKKLDAKIREILLDSMVAAVYVMAGPLYERNMPPLSGTSKAHQVPSGYWKIASMYDPHGPKVAAFYFDQEMAEDADFCDHLVSIDKIEQLTGLNFFHEFSPSRFDALKRGPSEFAGHLGCENEEE